MTSSIGKKNRSKKNRSKICAPGLADEAPSLPGATHRYP
jgi:hypothetical protein